jgi:Na+-transporting NADH:ubiquinone oxidoreductase subunit A
MLIKLSKGLNIPVAGAPAQIVDGGADVFSVALHGGDYNGLKPSLTVAVGDSVEPGQELFHDKRDPDVPFTAPGGGRVIAINRGPRRSLTSVVIELDEHANHTHAFEYLARTAGADLSADAARTILIKAGLWTAFRTRPYSKVPRSDAAACPIFVTAIDTRPLAADPLIITHLHATAFTTGLQMLARLTDKTVYLCTAPDWDIEIPQGVVHARFAGPHPAGLPGTHIHHLRPVDARHGAWHIGYQDVIAIGKLFGEGRIWNERVVALGGAGFKKPRLVRSRLGANISNLVADELETNDRPLRLMSGSVLEGRKLAGPDGWLGRYDLQVSAIPDAAKRQLFGWLGLFAGQYSFASALSDSRHRKVEHEFSTAAFGRPAALVPIDAFDRIIPMDILTVPLLRALLIKDTDQAQALGCLELDAEDLALCSFVCPGKNEYGAALQMNLAQIERDG